MSMASVNETEIFYREAGDGAPYLVMHGGLGFDHSYLTPGLDMLGDMMHLIYYDHRCNGRSGRPPIETLTFAQLADDADALRAHLGHDTVSVIAHSIIGCAIGMEYALRHPLHVDQLILVCATPRFDPADPAFGARLAAKGLTPEMADAFAHAGESDAAFRRYAELAGPLYHHAYEPKRYRRQIRGIIFCAAALVRSFEIAAQWSIADRLGVIATPTLLISGDSDPFATPEDATTLQRAIPGAQLVVLDRSGHFPWIEQPQDFAVAIKSWLAR